MFAIQISIHTQDKIYENVADDVRSWQTTKNYGVPAGTWSMQLVPRSRDGDTWFEKLSAQDFVWIRLSVNNGPFETVMNGLINRVHRQINTNSQTGEVTESIQVTGSDLGKIFTQFHVWYNPYRDGTHALVMGLVDLSEIIKGFSPAKALEGLLAVLLDDDSVDVVKNLKRRLAAEGREPLINSVALGNRGIEIKDLLKVNASIPEDIFADVSEITTFEGAIWNAFTKWGNEPWNEVFVDNGAEINSEDKLGQGGASSLKEDADVTFVNLREAPFLPDRFEKLATHEISYEDIQSPFSISKGDADTYTYYFARPILTLATGVPLYAEVLTNSRPISRERGITRSDGSPAVSVIERFGFRPLKEDYIYELRGERQVVGEDGVIALAKKLSLELFDFFDQNPEFLMGNIGLKVNRLARNTGRLIKMGHRIRIVNNPKGRPPEAYYITGVVNNWTFSNTFTQSLSLTRGIHEQI